jgi:hypothetical protein
MLMDKLDPSSARARRCFLVIATAFSILLASSGDAITLSQAEALRIGKKIWQNECDGTVAGLTSWNEGEDFASLGIGHFIWYPEGKRGPFEESFPKLVTFLQDRHVALPDWLAQMRACPWNSRSEFMRAQKSPELTQLRELLARTVDVQTQFLIDRLQNALPKMLDETAAANRALVEQMFQRVAASSHGCYALIDYVNFKGEGVLHTERYNGEGWGLLQVLETMRPNASDTVTEFSRSAAIVLKRRVANSPPARHESRWLSGWLNRVTSYSRR